MSNLRRQICGHLLQSAGQYFMTEGILSKQTVFLSSLDDSPKDVVEKPLDVGEVEKDKTESIVENEENEEMAKYGLRIAWRYNDLPIVSSEKTNTQIGHHFNLLEQMNVNMLKYSNARP